MSEYPSYKEIIKGIKNIDNENPYSELLKNSFKGIQHFEKMKLRESESVLKINDALGSGVIEIESLANMIQGLQSTVEGAFNYLLGNGSNYGKIPERYSEQAKLVATAFNPGSLIISINSKDDMIYSNQVTLFDMPSTDLKTVVDEILVDINTLEDNSQVTDFIEKYGYRAFSRSKAWINSVKTIEFEYETFTDSRRLIFEEPMMRKISEIMDELNLDEREDSIELKGKLKTVNGRLSTLTFEVENEEITVQILDDSIQKLNLLTNKYYHLKVKRITTKVSDQRESVEYLMDTLYGTELEIELN